MAGDADKSQRRELRGPDSELDTSSLLSATGDGDICVNNAKADIKGFGSS